MLFFLPFIKFCLTCFISIDLSNELEEIEEMPRLRRNGININTNSRYKYQYICSYDASNDFSLSKKIKNNTIICTRAKTSKNNNIESNKIYYCSRTNIPKNNTYINIKYCNNNIGYKELL